MTSLSVSVTCSAGEVAPTMGTCRRGACEALKCSTLTRITPGSGERSVTVSVGPCSVSPRCLMGRVVTSSTTRSSWTSTA